MRIEIHSLPKFGHAPDENEDAHAHSSPDAFPFRAAVADGATESAFSGEWARTLVAQYTAYGDLVKAIASARTLFAPAPDGRWYVEAKAAEGAHAALLGLVLAADGTWRAESIGDCCLFHVRAGSVIDSWPFTDPGAFHHRPDLISSQGESDTFEQTAEQALEGTAAQSAEQTARQASHQTPKHTLGTWRNGDEFMLMTDALAAWLLDAGITVLLEADDVTELFERARRAGATPSLRNDDTTAVIIHL